MATVSQKATGTQRNYHSLEKKSRKARVGGCFRGCSSLNCRGQVAEFDISAGFRRAGVGRNNPFAGKELGNIAFSPDETGHTISAESQPRRAVRRRGEAGNQEKGPAGGGATNGGAAKSHRGSAEPFGGSPAIRGRSPQCLVSSLKPNRGERIRTFDFLVPNQAL